MTKHYYDSRVYRYQPEPHRALIRAWHKGHGLPFPPSHDTYYDDVSRQVFQGSFVVLAKTPPPRVGKIAVPIPGFRPPHVQVLEEVSVDE